MSTYNSTNSASVNENPALITLKLDAVFNLKQLSLKLFKLLVELSNVYIEVCPSREWLAFQLRCTVHHVDKLIKYLISIGAIIKIKRDYLVTNLYKLNDIFYIAEIREQMAEFIDGFAVWGMASLMRAKAIFRKNESLLSMYLNKFKYICLYNINKLSDRASEISTSLLNKYFTKKGNSKAKKIDASEVNLQDKQYPYRFNENNEYVRGNSPHLTMDEINYNSPRSAAPSRKYNPNKDRVHSTKNGTKHFDPRYYFPRSNEEIEAERNEYLISIRYKSKLEDPNYDPMFEVGKVQAAINKRVENDYYTRFPERNPEVDYLNLNLDGFDPISDEEREAFRLELIKNLA